MTILRSSRRLGWLVVLVWAWPLFGQVRSPATRSPAPLTLWWQQPAKQWDHAIPLGNGRLGAMVFGRVADETIQFNEESLWRGGPRDTNNPEALESLPEVRRLLFEGQPGEAIRLANERLMGKPMRLLPYQSFGNLELRFPGHESPADYRLELDLDAAVAKVAYRIGAVQFTREIFVSAPDQVLVVRLTASSPSQLSFEAGIDREEETTTTAQPPNRLILSGQLDSGAGLRFQATLEVLPEGGTLVVSNDVIRVSGANTATLLLAANTSYRAKTHPAIVSSAQVQAAAGKSYPRLKAEHIADHQRLFRRVHLDLGGRDRAAQPTDARLEAMRNGADDPHLAVQYFQFARYLLLASSRPGDLPANLQGLWAEGMSPPWNSDYHLNINLQMNYWPAETANLAECVLPLVDYLESLREPGRRTAQVHYGAGGFVAHHISDIWGFTTPGDGAQWGLWPMGAAWLCLHAWDHYRFNPDPVFLRDRAYPVMKEAALFFLDYLVEDPKGRLVTGPSISPENSYRLPNGQVGVLCMGPTMDTQIVRELFQACIQAAEVLGTDKDFRRRLTDTLDRLPPTEIGRHGQIMEWSEDYEEPEPGHRHISHLFGLHPGTQITVHDTPDLAAAARATLERRLEHGGGHTGWSRAWIINFWARLEQGDLAHTNLLALLSKSTLPNLLDLHPPFQIDGNFGGAAGILEMLLQSHTREIQFLPALPRAWSQGRVTGLRARGGYTVGIEWRNHQIELATLIPDHAGLCRVRTPHPVQLCLEGVPTKAIEPTLGVLEFRVKPGRRYELRPISQ